MPASWGVLGFRKMALASLAGFQKQPLGFPLTSVPGAFAVCHELCEKPQTWEISRTVLGTKVEVSSSVFCTGGRWGTGTLLTAVWARACVAARWAQSATFPASLVRGSCCLWEGKSYRISWNRLFGLSRRPYILLLSPSH